MDEQKEQLKLNYRDIPEENTILIEGIRYHYQFFKDMGLAGWPLNRPFVIISRKEDGALAFGQFAPQQPKAPILVPKLVVPKGRA